MVNILTNVGIVARNHKRYEKCYELCWETPLYPLGRIQ